MQFISRILFLAFFILLPQRLFTQDSLTVVVISPRVGPGIDAAERDQFRLFNNYKNFSRAVFYRAPDSSFYVRIQQKTPLGITDTIVPFGFAVLRMLGEKINHYEALLDGSYHMGDDPAILHTVDGTPIAGAERQDINASSSPTYLVGSSAGPDTAAKTPPLSSSVGIEYQHLAMKNSIEAPEGASFMLSARIRTSDHTQFVVDVPYAFASFSYPVYNYANGVSFFTTQTIRDNTVGNPYLGFRLYSKNSASSVDVGVRLPVVSEHASSAWVYGMFSDIDRIDAFVPNLLTVNAIAHGNFATGQGLTLNVGFGPSFWIWTKTDMGNHNLDLFLSWAIQPGYEDENFRVMLGFTGKMNTTSDVVDVSDRFVDQYGASLSFRIGNFWPELHVRVPANNNLKESIDSVYGFGLSYVFD